MSTAVFFHAHPDDEALLTAGTMARLAAEGHRVVLVTATSGEAGLAADRITAAGPLGDVRADELTESARILGCARVVVLGYPDSGSRAVPRAGSFSTVPVELAARRLAEILDEEHADLVTGYDPAGGYGHADHVQLHRVTRAAVRLARTPLLLEATVDRRALQRALRLTAVLTRRDPDFDADRFERCYADPDEITHRIRVAAFAGRKRAAMRAHASQSTSDAGRRGLDRFQRLPLPLFRLVFGREWYVDPTRRVGRRKLDHPLGSEMGASP